MTVDKGYNTPVTTLKQLGDLPIEVFLRDYWQKKPVVIRQAIPQLSNPISPDELAGLACEEAVESRIIHHNPTANTWSLETGPFAEEYFAELPDTHWTLLVQAVDHWVPEAHALLKLFNFIPNWRLDDLMVSYASDGGGVGPHYDNYDVFLIQTLGVRCWEFGGHFNEHSPRRPNTPVMIIPEWSAEQTVDLHPGDLLYLPPGIGHNGYAKGSDCMTCSVGFRAPGTAEMLENFAQFLSDRTSHDARYQDPQAPLQTHPGEITHSSLQHAHQLILDAFSDTQAFNRWFGCYVTAPKYSDETLSIDASQLDYEQQFAAYIECIQHNELTIIPSEGSRISWIELTTGLDVFCNGQHTHITSPDAIHLVKLLSSQPHLNHQDINKDDTQSLNLLGNLLCREVLYIE